MACGLIAAEPFNPMLQQQQPRLSRESISLSNAAEFTGTDFVTDELFYFSQYRQRWPQIRLNSSYYKAARRV